MKTTNLITKKTAEMTSKKRTRGTPERQFPVIQKGKHLKLLALHQPWWHLREMLTNQTN